MEEVQEKDVEYYKKLSLRPVAPPKPMKVKAQARKFEEVAKAAVATSSSSPRHDNSQPGNDETHGLRILGCSVPGIDERPVSAATRLGSTLVNDSPAKLSSPTTWMAKNMITTTDEFGDIMELSEGFQKLTIARNNAKHLPGPCDGAGDGPAVMSTFEAGEPTAESTPSRGITIQSLTSNVVVTVPETHRNTQCSQGERPSTVVSSGEEVPIFPIQLLQKSKIVGRRRRAKKTQSGEGKSTPRLSKDFHRSRPDPDEASKGHASGTPVNNYDDGPSDVGADPEMDCRCAPPTGASMESTCLNPFEEMRPETAAIEELDEMDIKEDDNRLKCLMDAFQMEYEVDWYNPVYEDCDVSEKDLLLQLTKLFYMKIARSGKYSYKLALGGLQNRLEDIVLLPVPPGFQLKTRITRVKRGVAGRLYYMHLERTVAGHRKCLLLIAKKCQSFRGSSYILTTDPCELTDKSKYCVGKLCSNFIGTEFTLYGGQPICTDTPLDKGALQALPQKARFKEELAAVKYDTNVLGLKGPRKIKVILPRMKNILERTVIRPEVSAETLTNQFDKQKFHDIWCLPNKDPLWAPKSHSYTLDFSSRVAAASVKNFQICCPHDDDTILLQFGRVSNNTFNLDFKFPFCPLQAFAIALSSFDSKLACE